MVLSCLGVVGGHHIRAAKALVVSEPIAIFHAGIKNPNWLVEIRVCRILQVACPRTVIYLTKLHKKLLAILLYACGAVERQQGSKVLV